MGSSGCGKTTTLRMLAGLEAPTEGEIRLRGKRINELPTWQRDMPMVWQSLALFPFLTCVENVEFGLRMRGVAKAERRKRVDKWLERMRTGEFAEPRTSPQIFPAASANASRSPVRWSPSRRYCCSTNRCRRSMHISKVRMQAVLIEPPARTGHHLRLCHAQPVGSLLHGRPGGHHEPGPHRADRQAAARSSARRATGSSPSSSAPTTSFQARSGPSKDETAMIETPAGVLPAKVPATGIAAGQKVDMVISADMVQLTADPAPGFPELPSS